MSQPAVLTDKTTRNFLIVGKAEGYSYLLLLFIAMPLKYIFKFPEAVQITGMVHGLLFVLFIIVIIQCMSEKKLTVKGAFLAFLLSLVPFGTFFLKSVLPKKD